MNDNAPEVLEPRAGHESTITLHLRGAGVASKVAGETIGSVRARDADAGANAELRYAIEPACRIPDRAIGANDQRVAKRAAPEADTAQVLRSGGTSSNNQMPIAIQSAENSGAMSERALSLVRVEVVTGKLFLARPLEASDAGAHRLCVRVADGGRPPMETLTELLLVIRNASGLDRDASDAFRTQGTASGIGGGAVAIGHRVAAAADRVVWRDDASGAASGAAGAGAAAAGSGGELDWTHVRPAVLWLASTLMLASFVLLCALVAAIAYRRSKERDRMSPLSLRIPDEFAVSTSNLNRFHSNNSSHSNAHHKRAIGCNSGSRAQQLMRDSHSNANHCVADCSYESRSPARSVGRTARTARLCNTSARPPPAAAVEGSQRSPYLCVERQGPSRKESTNSFSCVSEVNTREPSLVGVGGGGGLSGVGRNEHSVVYRMDSNEHSIVYRVNSSDQRSFVSRMNSGELERMNSTEREETFSRLRRHMSLVPVISYGMGLCTNRNLLFCKYL